MLACLSRRTCSTSTLLLDCSFSSRMVDFSSERGQMYLHIGGKVRLSRVCQAEAIIQATSCELELGRLPPALSFAHTKLHQRWLSQLLADSRFLMAGQRSASWLSRPALRASCTVRMVASADCLHEPLSNPITAVDYTPSMHARVMSRCRCYRTAETLQSLTGGASCWHAATRGCPTRTARPRRTAPCAQSSGLCAHEWRFADDMGACEIDVKLTVQRQ